MGREGGHGNPLQPGEPAWTEEPGGLQSVGDGLFTVCKESDMTEATAHTQASAFRSCGFESGRIKSPHCLPLFVILQQF